jgi:hypothetical protein
MATAQDHLRQAQHNRDFLARIDAATYPDWAATVMFYTAVHRAQQLFEMCGGSGGTHKKRNNTLRDLYPAVWREYYKLYSYSRLARYRCMQSKPEHVPHLERRLRQVESAIERRLSAS